MEMNLMIKRINWYTKKARIITTVCKPQDDTLLTLSRAIR